MTSLQHWFVGRFDWWNLLVAAVIIIGFAVFSRSIIHALFRLIERFIPENQVVWRDLVIAFERSVKIIVLFSGLLWALHVLALPHFVLTFALQLYRSILIFSIGLGIMALVGTITQFVHQFGANKFNLQFDEIVVPFVTRVLKFIVGALIATMILSDWGFNINGVVAGLGLAGLAVSMAAQDYIRNLMGGVTIITEAPFTIGDWIATPSAEGIVEDINFRATILRDFEDALVTVPNATLASQPITNWSRVQKRKIQLDFYLDTATTPAELQTISTTLSASLIADSRFEADTVRVFLNQITATGQEWRVIAFLLLDDDADFLSAKADVATMALDVLVKNDIKLLQQDIVK